MEAEIIELEKKYWDGMENHNYETVRSLTHFPCIVASKNGVQSVDEATFKKMFESGDGDKIKVVNITDFQTQTTDTTATVAYIIELGIADNEGKPPVKCACTSTWFKEDGNWLCAMHTEAELSRN